MREAFEKSSPPQYLRTAYMLGRWLGLRAADIVRIGPNHRQTVDAAPMVVIRCGKTIKSSGADACASISNELQTYLDSLPKSLLYVLREDGTPVGPNALAKQMRKRFRRNRRGRIHHPRSASPARHGTRRSGLLGARDHGPARPRDVSNGCPLYEGCAAKNARRLGREEARSGRENDCKTESVKPARKKCKTVKLEVA